MGIRGPLSGLTLKASQQRY